MEEKDQEFIDTEESVDDDIDFEDFDFDDDEEESEETEKKQSREENREQAKARRERERIKREKEMKEAIETARKEGYEKAKKESYLENNKINAFTGQPIKDEYDLKIYEMQKKIKDEGGDPINDLASHIAESNRTKDISIKEEKEKELHTKEAVKQQVADFKAKFPNENAKEILVEGSPFRKYADGKLGGKKTIIELYEDYQAFVKSLVDENNLAKEKEDGKNKASVPSSNGSKTKAKKSVANMTDEEFIQYWVDKNGSF